MMCCEGCKKEICNIKVRRMRITCVYRQGVKGKATRKVWRRKRAVQWEMLSGACVEATTLAGRGARATMGGLREDKRKERKRRGIRKERGLGLHAIPGASSRTRIRQDDSQGKEMNAQRPENCLYIVFGGRRTAQNRTEEKERTRNAERRDLHN